MDAGPQEEDKRRKMKSRKIFEYMNSLNCSFVVFFSSFFLFLLVHIWCR